MAQPVFAPQMLRAGVEGALIEAEMVERPPFLYQRIADVFPSTRRKENYAWLGNPPSMEKFVGEPIMHQIGDTGLTAQTGMTDPGYEITNNTYQGILTFNRDDLADDQVGGYQQRIDDQIAAANGFPDEEIITHLINGETYTCYLQSGATGEAMFSATHAARGAQTSTWSNKHTGTGTDVSNFQADIASALTLLYTVRNEGNRPMNRYCRQLFILCPVALEPNMRTAVYAQMVSQTSNVGFSPSIEVIAEPLLDADDANDWYIGTLDGGRRGLGWQDREGVMAEEVGEGSETWVNLRQVEYAVTRRGAPMYVYPQRLVLVANT